jgi:hypothetical protein
LSYSGTMIAQWAPRILHEIEVCNDRVAHLRAVS